MALYDENQERSPYRGKVQETFHQARRRHAINDLNAFMGVEHPLSPADLAIEYFNDGLKYFRKNSDPYLEILEKEAGDAISDGIVSVHYGGDMPQESQKAMNPKDKPCMFVVEPIKDKYAHHDKAGIFVFPSLVIEAQLQPVFLLANMAENLSLMRDYANARTYPQDVMRTAISRSKATQAHLLHNALREDSILQHQIMSEYGELLARFPRGIDSLSGARYRSIGRDPKSN